MNNKHSARRLLSNAFSLPPSQIHLKESGQNGSNKTHDMILSTTFILDYSQTLPYIFSPRTGMRGIEVYLSRPELDSM